MACGTPVIAYRRGSVPEVVDDGVTDTVVDNEEEAIAAIKRLGELDRRVIRATFELRFTVRRPLGSWEHNQYLGQAALKGDGGGKLDYRGLWTAPFVPSRLTRRRDYAAHR
jgi:glycosyltransferase involved in cell wall biosynthesis